MTLNKAEVLRLSRKLDRREMTLWLRNATGKRITAAEFNKIMFDLLPLEQVYQTEVMDYIKTVPGAFVWKAAAGPYSRQGIPDVCAVIDGHFFGFEIKRPYIGRATKIQEKTMDQIRAAGGTAAVVSTWLQAKEEIELWMKCGNH